MLKFQSAVWANHADLQHPTFVQMQQEVFKTPFWSRIWEYPWVGQHASPQIDQVLVDMGAAGSPLPSWFAAQDPSIKVYSVDLTPTPFTSQIVSLQESLTSTSIPSSSVDTVVCVSVLEHMEPDQWEKALVEFDRILKPLGKLILTLDVADVPECPFHFNPQELKTFMDRLGGDIPLKPTNIIRSSDSAKGRRNGSGLVVLGVLAQKKKI